MTVTGGMSGAVVTGAGGVVSGGGAVVSGAGSIGPVATRHLARRGFLRRSGRRLALGFGDGLGFDKCDDRSASGVAALAQAGPTASAASRPSVSAVASRGAGRRPPPDYRAMPSRGPSVLR
ncbi:hypothetical protein NKG94_30850 [Micromonospora sp. M12]